MPELVLNGEKTKYAEADFPATLADLLARLRMPPENLAAEVDGRVVRREDFDACTLKPGSCVELVRFVGGG